VPGSPYPHRDAHRGRTPVLRLVRGLPPVRRRPRGAPGAVRGESPRRAGTACARCPAAGGHGRHVAAENGTQDSRRGLAPRSPGAAVPHQPDHRATLHPVLCRAGAAPGPGALPDGAHRLRPRALAAQAGQARRRRAVASVAGPAARAQPEPPGHPRAARPARQPGRGRAGVPAPGAVHRGRQLYQPHRAARPARAYHPHRAHPRRCQAVPPLARRGGRHRQTSQVRCPGAHAQPAAPGRARGLAARPGLRRRQAAPRCASRPSLPCCGRLPAPSVPCA
jgi:hypothetical protein